MSQLLDHVKSNLDHNLKIGLQFFEEVAVGNKAFEVRSTLDRDFKAGDYVLLREWWEDHYSGREVAVVITYVTDYLQMPDTVVFGFKVVA